MLNLNQLKNLYNNSPLWLKKIYASIPYDIRNGKEYRKWKKFLEENLDVEEYEILKIKEIVLYAYKNTKYYKSLLDNLHLDPNDINEKKDFEKIPYLTKEIVKENYNDLIAYNFPKRKSFYVTTGGFTGTPTKFLQSNNVWSKELAFIMNYFSKYGYKPPMKKASFRGGDFNNISGNKYYKENPNAYEIHFSPFHINEKTIKYYVKALNKLKPRFFHTYPSSILLLIDHMENANLKLEYRIKTIFLISENFDKNDIERISSFFNCTVSSFYGHSERVIFAPSASDKLNSYKIDRRYGYFELIDTNKEVIDGNFKKGEMVGTSFDNYAMPLIRYRTNDFTEYIDISNKIISKIQGRWNQEYLIGKDGLKFYLSALNMHSDIFKNVITYQFIQTEAGYSDLNLIVKKKFTNADKNEILNAMNKKLGHALSLNIKVVEKPILTSRGKFKIIIKHIK